jgi:hypothetical protein
MVTDRPTETMNSTMPAAIPPRRMLATSMPKITGERPKQEADTSRPPLAVASGGLDLGEEARS